MSKKSGLTKRQKLIIEMLAAFNADDPITIQAISEKLKLSSRTVLREMPRINEWFEENDFKLVKKPRIGMYVDEDTNIRFASIDPSECVVVYDNTLQENIMFAIRYYDEKIINSEDVITHIEVYDKNNITF